MKGSPEDFIMDDLTLVYYHRHEDEWTERVTCKLLILDFLNQEKKKELVLPLQFLPSIDPNLCANCKEFLKEKIQCSRCREVSYCSPLCQRIDRFNHKMICVFKPKGFQK